MYEDIDDTEPGEASAVQGRNRLLIGAAIFAGVVILVIATAFSGGADKAPAPDLATIQAEQSAYLAALSDSSAALRRARLKDFLATYPNSERRAAARAQLRVIENAEAKDWAALTHIVYDTQQGTETKLSAIAAYDAIWSSALLGGRESEVKRLRKGLELETQVLPERDLPIDPVDVPQNVPGDALLGGARGPQTGYVPPRFTDERPDNYAAQDVVVPAALRRNRRPKYPRRALERGIEATVTLGLFIDDRGRVEMVELLYVEADRYGKDFVRAAERAALRMRYEPRRVNGKRVPSANVEKTFRFEIGG